MASLTRTCYSRNGTVIKDLAYRPCSNDTSHDSFCCGTNHQGAGQTLVADDVCETNGLCQNYEAYDGTNQGVKLWWRQGCTDPTWQSEQCLGGVCDYGLWQNDNAPVRKCGDNSWCCGEKTCCSISSSLFALAATVGPTPKSTPASSVANPTLTSASNTTPAVILTALPNASPSFTPASGNGGGLSTGARAGIGIGVALVVILLAIIAFLLVKLMKKKDLQRAELDGGYHAGREKQPTVTYAHHGPPAELDGRSAPVEMGGGEITELPGERRYR